MWWNVRSAEGVLSREDDGSFVFAQTFQPINYKYQRYADGFASSDGISSLGIDLDGDGENDFGKTLTAQLCRRPKVASGKPYGERRD